MKTIKVPDSWSEVSIGTYQELIEAEKDFEKVSILIDEDPEEVRKYDPTSMTKLVKHLSWTTRDPDHTILKHFIEVDGVEYRLVDLNKFSLGEWIDMDEYVREFNQNLHLVVSMLYRPAGEYKAEDVISRAHLFRDKVMIGDVYGSFVFFSLVATKSMQCIQLSLIKKLLIQTKQQKKKGKGFWRKRRQRNGPGIITPTV